MIDAFLLNTRLDDQIPMRYHPRVIERMSIVRSGPGLHRWYSVPPDMEQSIPARDTFIHQVSTPAGTILWGMAFEAIDGTPSQFLIQIWDGDRNHAIAGGPVSAAHFDIPATAAVRPWLLSEPERLENGLLNVEIHNTAAVAQRCQLLLWVTEPGGTPA